MDSRFLYLILKNKNYFSVSFFCLSFISVILEKYLIISIGRGIIIVEVSSAVANSAVETGVARIKEFDLEKYREKLASMI